MLGKIVGRDEMARRRLYFPDMESRQHTARRAKAPYRDERNLRQVVYARTQGTVLCVGADTKETGNITRGTIPSVL